MVPLAEQLGSAVAGCRSCTDDPAACACHRYVPYALTECLQKIFESLLNARLAQP